MADAAPAEPDSRASWRTLAGTGVLAMFGVQALYGVTFGLFMLPLQQELGWSRGDIAFSLTLTTLLTPLVVPLIGWTIDHVPLRPLILWGVLLQSLNFAAFSMMSGSIWVYYGLCVVFMFTSSGASVLTLAKFVQGWFDKKLGRALGLLFACGGIGGIIHPLWTHAVISNYGWRQAFVVMGALSFVLCTAAAWVFVRERVPASARLPQPAAAPAASVVPETPAAPAASAAGPTSMAAFLRDPIWWKLALFNMLFAFGVGGIFLHFAPLLQDRGATPAQAAVAMSIISASGLVGNVVAGWLLDRMSARRLAVIVMLLPLFGLLAIYTEHRLEVSLLAAAVVGLCWGGDNSLSIFLARHYFSPATFGRAAATQMIATAAGGGISPWLAGLVFDHTGNYDAALLVGVACLGGAALAAAWLPESRAAAQGRALARSAPA